MPHYKSVRTTLQYPSSDTPAIVANARRTVLAIPPQDSSMIPANETSVAVLLDFKLPAQQPSLVIESTLDTFSNDKPNQTFATCATQMIPPRAYIYAAEKAFGQAWFDAAKSIIGMGYKRIPLLRMPMKSGSKSWDVN